MRVLSSASRSISNGLLSTMPQEEWDALRPLLTRVRLVPEQVLIERGQTVEHVFFIEEGLAFLTSDFEAGRKGAQVAMIGNEGMIGSLALLGTESTAFANAVTHIPGPALRIPVRTLTTHLRNSPVLHQACFTYVQTLTRQVMETAAYNACTTLAKRCVRWLLMAHDRTEGDDLAVTHETLSAMLGVRRSGVTVTTAALDRQGLIRTSRGRIRILNREGLEDILAGRGRPPAAPGRAELSPAP